MLTIIESERKHKKFGNFLRTLPSIVLYHYSNLFIHHWSFHTLSLGSIELFSKQKCYVILISMWLVILTIRKCHGTNSNHFGPYSWTPQRLLYHRSIRRGYRKEMNILKISWFPDFIQCFPDFSQHFPIFHYQNFSRFASANVAVVWIRACQWPVSYTHLTLPTIYSV